MPIFIAYAFVFCFGLCVGSFLNVCVYRLPREMSLSQPPSHCPHCNEPIAWFDNIPVVSWLMLRGLCRRCGVLISRRYVMGELLTGIVFVWIFAAHRSALSAPVVPGEAGAVLALVPTFGAYIALASALVVASLIDIERMMIPDEVSIGGMYVGPLLCIVWPHIIEHDNLLTGWVLRATGADGSVRLAGLAASVIGMGTGAAVIYVAGVFGRLIFRKEAMGFGDVKFMGMVGAFIGWSGAVVAFSLACIYGAVVGIVLLLRKRDTHIPFGPYLAAGSLTVMLHKPAVLQTLFDFPMVIWSLFT